MHFVISFHFKVRKGEAGKSTRVKTMCVSFLEDLLRKHVLAILLYIVVGIYYTQGLNVWWSLKKIFVILQDFFFDSCNLSDDPIKHDKQGPPHKKGKGKKKGP
jgi:hypothetical protein